MGFKRVRKTRKGGEPNWQFYYNKNSVPSFSSPLLRGGKSRKRR